MNDILNAKSKIKTSDILEVINIDYVEQCLEDLSLIPKYADIIQPILNRIQEIRDYLNINYNKMNFESDFNDKLKYNINYILTKNKIKILLDDYSDYYNDVYLKLDKAKSNREIYDLSFKYNLNNYGLTKLSYNIVSVQSNILNNLANNVITNIKSLLSSGHSIIQQSKLSQAQKIKLQRSKKNLPKNTNLSSKFGRKLIPQTLTIGYATQVKKLEEKGSQKVE